MHNHTTQIQSTSNKDVAALCPAPEGLGLATDLLPRYLAGILELELPPED